MAEREGFEPPIGLHLCRISSAVHSTTLPPLRGAKTGGRPPESGEVLGEDGRTDKAREGEKRERRPRDLPPCRPLRRDPGALRDDSWRQLQRLNQMNPAETAEKSSASACPARGERARSRCRTVATSFLSLDRKPGDGPCRVPSQSLPFFSLSFLSLLRLVKRALPRPVPMVSTPQCSTSCMKGTSLKPWATPSLCISAAVS
jgi:hypothetical protein